MSKKINIEEIIKLRSEEKRKIINYGKFYATIDNVEVKKINNSLFNVKFLLVGYPIDNFEGFEDKVTKKKYNAPISTVSLSRYLIDSNKSYNINRNVRKIINIVEQLEQRHKIKDEYNSLDEFLNDFKKINFKGNYAYFVIGARELGYNDKGYKKYSSFILDNETINGIEYYGVHKDKNRIISFDEEKHIIPMNDNSNTVENIPIPQQKNNDNLPDFLKDKPKDSGSPFTNVRKDDDDDIDINEFMDKKEDKDDDIDINEFMERKKDDKEDPNKLPF